MLSTVFQVVKMFFCNFGNFINHNNSHLCSKIFVCDKFCFFVLFLSSVTFCFILLRFSLPCDSLLVSCLDLSSSFSLFVTCDSLVSVYYVSFVFLIASSSLTCYMFQHYYAAKRNNAITRVCLFVSKIIG